MNNKDSLKDLFSPFFQPKFDAELLTKKDTLIVIDTNYLLTILRLAPDSAQKYINALKKNEENIYVPYLVALEFLFNKKTIQKNKLKYLDHPETLFDEILQSIESSPLESIKDWVSDEQEKKIKEKCDEFIHNLKEVVSTKQIKKVEDDNNRIYDELIKTINTKIGVKPDQKTISEIQKSGEERYEEKFPPGYNDKKKDGTRRFSSIHYEKKFGDLLIWKDMIEKAKESSSKRIIFVTDDGQASSKKDLYYEIAGEKIGPSIQLMDELKTKSEAELYIIKSKFFVEKSVTLDVRDKKQIEDLASRMGQEHTEHRLKMLDKQNEMLQRKKVDSYYLPSYRLEKMRIRVRESIEEIDNNADKLVYIEGRLNDLHTHMLKMKEFMKEEASHSIDNDEDTNFVEQRNYGRRLKMYSVQEQVFMHELVRIQNTILDDDTE